LFLSSFYLRRVFIFDAFLFLFFPVPVFFSTDCRLFNFSQGADVIARPFVFARIFVIVRGLPDQIGTPLRVLRSFKELPGRRAVLARARVRAVDASVICYLLASGLRSTGYCRSGLKTPSRYLILGQGSARMNACRDARGCDLHYTSISNSVPHELKAVLNFI
jgi:hypothetical protein